MQALSLCALLATEDTENTEVLSRKKAQEAQEGLGSSMVWEFIVSSICFMIFIASFRVAAILCLSGLTIANAMSASSLYFTWRKY